MRRLKALSFGASAAVLMVATPALAAARPASPPSAPSGGAAQVQEVIVTANKRAERLQDVAQAVSAVPESTLIRRQVVGLDDLAVIAPGLTVVTSQPGESRIVLRGINTGGVGATVGAYLDEAPFGSSTGLANGAVLAPDLDAFDLNRVEVLRGPQGTLYGASTLGGLIKYVTNAPVLGSFSGRLEGSYESVDQGGSDGSIRGMLNAPIGDKAAVRVSGYDQQLPGYIDDVGAGRKNVNGTNIYGGRASVLFKPREDFSMRLTAVDQKIDSKGTSVVDADPITLKPLHGDLTQSRTLAEPSEVEYRLYNATLNWRPSWGDVTSSTSFGRLSQTSVQDASVLYGDLLSAVFGGEYGSEVINNINQDKFTEELRVSSRKSDRLEWSAGAFYTIERAVFDQNLYAFDIPTQKIAGLPTLFRNVLSSRYIEGAFFGNIDYHFGRYFDLAVGGRYSTNSQSATQDSSGLLAGESPPTNTSSEDVFTYSVEPRWRFNDSSIIYGRVASGYRPGGPNQVSPPSALADPGSSAPLTYASDTVTSYEVGYKATLLDRKLTLDLAAFYVDWKKIQLLAVFNGVGANVNGGSAESKGFELSAGWTPLPGLTLTADGAYIDATLTSDTGPVLGGKSGDQLPSTPKWSSALSGDYEWTVFGEYKGFVGASWRYVGDRSSSFDPGLTAVVGRPQLRFPSYDQVDLRAGVRMSRYTLALYAKNVNDARGVTDATAFGTVRGGPNGGVGLYAIHPRTFGVTLDAAF